MNKEEFLNTLRERLSSYPQDDIAERISFYEEMLDDRIEEGMTEEEAVAAIGPIDDIVKQVTSEIPLTKLVMEKVKPKAKPRAGVIVLLVLGFPLWFPLLVTAFSIVFSLYVTLWALVIAIYAVAFSFAAVAVVSLPYAVQIFASGNVAGGLFMIGAGMAMAGLSILMFLASIAATRGAVKLTKGIFLWIKSLFVGKEG